MGQQGFRGPGVYRLGTTGVTVSVGTERTRKINRIREAMETGQILRCVYFGGSSAGTERPIHPREISGNDVWAVCLNTGQRKHYKLHRIKLLEDWESGEGVGPPEDYEEFERAEGARKKGSTRTGSSGTPAEPPQATAPSTRLLRSVIGVVRIVLAAVAALLVGMLIGLLL